jgi:hypothetical protein
MAQPSTPSTPSSSSTPQLFTIRFEGSLPGEALASKLLDAYIEWRKDMDPDLRRKWDEMQLEDYKQWRAFWAPLIQTVVSLTAQVGK